MKEILVIVPCGQRKIWDKHPQKGATPARYVYIGAPFKVNAKYAEAFSKYWVILSAKYGLITPEFKIPGPYNITFKKKIPTLFQWRPCKIRSENVAFIIMILSLALAARNTGR